MATAQDITRLMNSVQVHLPGATTDALQLQLFIVMDDFFKGTNTWVEDIDIQVPANDPAGTVYYLIPSSPATVERLMWSYQVPENGNMLRGAAVVAYMTVPGEVTLSTQPSSAATYRFTAALTVQDPVTRDGYVTFPAWILAKYRNVIYDGLIGAMMGQPNKPFTNMQLSVFHMRKFNSGVAQARVDTTRNNNYRAQAWAYPGFVRGGQRGRSGWAPPQ